MPSQNLRRGPIYVGSRTRSNLIVKPVTDPQWDRIEPLLPRYASSRKGGRPRVELRRVYDGIQYVLATRCRWRAVPDEFGSGATLHRYYQEWRRLGVFDRLAQAGVPNHDRN